MFFIYSNYEVKQTLMFCVKNKMSQMDSNVYIAVIHVLFLVCVYL